MKIKLNCSSLRCFYFVITDAVQVFYFEECLYYRKHKVMFLNQDKYLAASESQ